MIKLAWCELCGGSMIDYRGDGSRTVCSNPDTLCHLRFRRISDVEKFLKIIERINHIWIFNWVDFREYLDIWIKREEELYFAPPFLNTKSIPTRKSFYSVQVPSVMYDEHGKNIELAHEEDEDITHNYKKPENWETIKREIQKKMKKEISQIKQWLNIK